MLRETILKNGRFIAAGAAVILLIFVIATVTLSVTLNGERAMRATLQEKLADVMRERKKLAEETEELRLIKIDLESKIGGLEAQAGVLTKNYDKEKSQNDVIRMELNGKTKELDIAQAKLGSIESEKAALQEMLDGEKGKYNELKERVDKLVEVKTVLEEKVRDIINKQGIELERIVVKAEGDLEGKVVVVNREYNFIVTNIGAEDDIELGDFLTVFRGGKYVGEVQVEKIYDTMSAATILKETKPRAVMVGDNVIVRRD